VFALATRHELKNGKIASFVFKVEFTAKYSSLKWSRFTKRHLKLIQQQNGVSGIDIAMQRYGFYS
jgi:hypothetical protein